MKNNELKNNNAITINLNDELKKELEYIAEYYQRKTAELLRLLITPIIINEYATIQLKQHPENAQPMERATFKEVL